MAPSTSYSIHFFTQSLSSFHSTTYFAVVPRLCHLILVSLSQPFTSELLSFSLMPHIHLTILISAHWSATSSSFLTGQVSLPCNILLCTQLLYNLPLTINDISLLVSNGTNWQNLFHSIRILVSTASWLYIETIYPQMVTHPRTTWTQHSTRKLDEHKSFRH